MATDKSSSNIALTAHVIAYTCIWFIVLPFIFGLDSDSEAVGGWLLFCFITFICHWLTDYFTSRVVKQKFADKEYYTNVPNTGAFSIIGLDQLFHYFQLILTYKLLFL